MFAHLVPVPSVVFVDRRTAESVLLLVLLRLSGLADWDSLEVALHEGTSPNATSLHPQRWPGPRRILSPADQMHSGSRTITVWLDLARVYGHHVPETSLEPPDHLNPAECWPGVLAALKGKSIGESPDHERVLAALAELSQEVPPASWSPTANAAYAAAR